MSVTHPIVRSGAFALVCLVACPAHALGLREAERELDARNRDIALAETVVRGAEADARTAALRPAPDLTFSSSKISPIHGIGAGGYFDKRVDTTLGLGYLVERGGKRRWRGEQARSLARAAAFDLGDTRRQQHYALHEAYYGLKRAQETLQLARANRESAERELDALDRRVAAGDAAPVERARLAVDALKVVDDERSAALEHVEAQQALALLLGRENDYATLEASDEWPTPTDESLTAPTIERRADALAAAARVAAAEAARHAARGQRKRDVTIEVGAERDPRDQSGTSWGFSVSVPLFGPHYHDGAIQRAEADYDDAVITRDKVLAEAATDRERARLLLETTRARLRHYDRERVPAAQRALDGVEFAYRRGAAGLTDLLDARRAWRETRADLIAARSDHAIALAAWQAATQAVTDEVSPR